MSTEVTTTATVEPVKEVLAAPTIRLEIIEGPTLTADSVCYYRVKAIVTGNPYPAISFNKDDSLGSLGKNISQVNLYKEGDTFTLEATATNSQGTASASITLTDTCERPKEEEEEEEENGENQIPILVNNNTGGTLVINLNGPTTYKFSIPPGQQTIYVIPGTYSYKGRACGDAIKGTVDLSFENELTWWCD